MSASRQAAVGGRPLWQALAVLVLLPALAAAALGGTAVAASDRVAAQSVAAAQEVDAVARLDAVRRAVDAELLPTLVVIALADPELAGRLGEDEEARAALAATQPTRLATLRAASDAALEDLRSAPLGVDVAATANDTANRLVAARAAADGSGPRAEVLASAYQRMSNGLVEAQGRATARALSAGLSAPTAMALQDLQLVVELGQLGSRQLPLLLASRVTTGERSAADQRAWLAAWGAYTDLVGDDAPDDTSARWPVLWTPSLQARWDAALAEPAVRASSELLDAQAADPAREVLATSAIPSAALSGASRDVVVADLLAAAAAAVSERTAADAAAASSRARAVLVASTALVLVCLVTALLVGRWLARSSAVLAAAAQRVSLGELVEVPERGPRELRTASRALSAAVAGLRHVQEQARLVVAGRHDEALALPPLPGPLGRDVHAWTTQVARSVQAREQLQQQVAHHAAHDALTGLAARSRVLGDLDRVLRRDQEAGRRTGLLLIDLDGLKTVNEGHGHGGGDELLRAVADRLRAAARPGELVGRLGGDEFVLVVPDAPHGDALVRRATRLVRDLSQPVALEGGAGVAVGACVGATVTAGAGGPSGARALLAEADTAVRRAEAAGRGRVELFGDDLRRELAEAAATEQALRAALALGQLRVVYQPVVALPTAPGAAHEVLELEALLRWDRPGHGPVATGDLVAVAEQSSLVRDLGRFVLAEATLQLVRWTVRGHALPAVSVNLSGRHVADPRVVTDVLEALETSGLAPHQLVLEVTERVLAGDERAAQHLRALRAHGVRVAVDDFGTGFSSIASLATTPADQLKVARDLVVAEDPARQQLLALAVRAGRAFGLSVVALGVETAEQAARAAGAGCTGAQGWFLAGAVPAEGVPALVEELVDDLTGQLVAGRPVAAGGTGRAAAVGSDPAPPSRRRPR